MRTRLLILLVAVAAAVAVFGFGLGGGAGSYRAAAVFDTAKGMLPGELVKIAGARVGTVTAVKLRPGPTALIEFSLARRFAPFHADASCRILPEGPISEYYLDCRPGSPAAPALARSADTGLPTVPLAHTTVPVSLQDVLNIFSAPVGQRLGVLMSELGIGTAGRGADINAILRRANPTLTQGDRVLSILNAQNHQLADAVTQTRAVFGSLAERDQSVRGFIDHSASVAGTLAGVRAQLGAGVHRLPALLQQLDTGLVPINRVAVQGVPLLKELRVAAPALQELTHTLPAFVIPGGPAIQALGRASAQGLRAIPAAKPVVAQLARLAQVSATVLPSLDSLLVSTRDSGAFEGFLRLLYSLSTDSGAYDSISHYVSALIVPFPKCLAQASTPGCQHGYNSPGQGSVPLNTAADSASAATRTTGAHRTARAGRAPSWLPGSSTAAPARASSGTPPSASAPSPIPSQLQSLLGYLLR